MRTPRRGPSAILATTAWALPLVTLIPLAAPYLALGLEHTRGLQLQAAVILAGVLLVAATGLREGPRAWAARVLAAPRPLLIALACYAAAALWGAAVGLLRGVPPVGIASQLLSMGLLPLAAGAGLGLGSGGEPARRFTLTLWMGTLSMGTLWIGTGAAAALHLGLWLMRAASGASQIRHTVDIEAGVAGPSLLALLLALAFARSAPARGWRVAAGLAALLLGLYQLGTEVRGLWLVTVPAVPLFFLLAGWRPRLWRWGVAAGLLAAAAAGLAWWIHGWLERPRANLLPHTRPAALVRGESVEGLEILGRREHESSRRRVLAWSTGGTELRALPPAVPLGEAGLLRLTTTTWGPAEGTARVGLRWLDARGAALGEAVDEVPGGAQWRRNEMLALPPAGAASAQVVLGAAEPAAGDSWALQRVRLEHLDVPPALMDRGRYLLGQLRPLRAAFGPLELAGSARYRVVETRVLLARFREAPVHLQLAGHGLGATYSIDPAQVPDHASRLDLDRLSYVHNFYAFLLFKLGLVGSGLTLAGLFAWLPWLIRSLRKAEGPGRALLAAALAAWLAYCAWSVSSPEILDFRMAPLWGFLLAACARLARPEIPEGA